MTTSLYQFDLSNYSQARAHDLVAAAFGKPLDAPTEMVRFTFVVGGGKQVRSKYDEELPKWFTAALREIGFVEDRSSAVDFSSQGTYKQQHDTGQNLKTVIVFPRVSCADSKPAGGDDGGRNEVSRTSPDYIIAVCELSAFVEIVHAKAPSWTQKKKVLKCLQGAMEKFKGLESKLMRGEPLSGEEQAMYDSNSGEDDQKLSWIQAEIKSMVEQGRLTAREKAEVLNQMETNLANLCSEMEKARSEGKAKKVTAFEDKISTLTDKRNAVSAITPQTHHRLRLGDEIQKLRLKLLSFGPLEEKQRQGGLTLAELKQLEPKIDIEAQVASLEQASKGWFDNEEDFKLACDYEMKAAKTKYAAKVKPPPKKKAVGGGTVGGPSSRSTAKSGSGSMPWETIGVKKKTPTTAKSRPASGGFAAAFGGGESSSEDDY